MVVLLCGQRPPARGYLAGDGDGLLLICVYRISFIVYGSHGRNRNQSVQIDPVQILSKHYMIEIIYQMHALSSLFDKT